MGSTAECSLAFQAVAKEFEQNPRSIKMSILLQYYYSVYVQGLCVSPVLRVPCVDT